VLVSKEDREEWREVISTPSAKFLSCKSIIGILLDDLEELEGLVSKEREACAEVCFKRSKAWRDGANSPYNDPDEWRAMAGEAAGCGIAIKGRGNDGGLTK